MAHILKIATANYKGIVVLTHKELKYFQQQITKRDIVLFPNLVIKYFLRLIFKKIISDIRRNNFIIIHWGGYARNVNLPPWVDGNMTSPGTATFRNSPYTIPLASSHFTPEIMRDKNLTKLWDFIMIAKNKKSKNIKEFLQACKKALLMRTDLKFLILISSNQTESNETFYNDIWDDYHALFTEEEKEQVTIIKTDYKMGFQGLSYSAVSSFLNLSRVFCLFSTSEGHAKVVKEAQLCGLPVIIKRDLTGGVKDSLTEGKNAFYFDTFEDAHLTLLDTLNKTNNMVFEDAEKNNEIMEKTSISSLKKYIGVLYDRHNQEFDGVLDNTQQLNRRLPAHLYDPRLTWIDNSRLRYSTTDICSFRQLKRLKEALHVQDYP